HHVLFSLHVALPILRFSRFNKRLGMTGYLIEILLVTLSILALVFWALSAVVPAGQVTLVYYVIFLLLAAIPASEMASALVNRWRSEEHTSELQSREK